MESLNKTAQANDVWNLSDWQKLERHARASALAARSESEAWRVITAKARVVMRTYSTSFFIVSRFLPATKRAQVEAIYAAVRYPDEIVDTFPLTPQERIRLLDNWAEFYEQGLMSASLTENLQKNVPCFLASFTKVVRDAGIPTEHYRSFIDAMRRDVAPRAFASLDDLIENYIYGSAIVVGYFLAFVYGADLPQNFPRALASSRDLGIALQLTNFVRDVAEDERRGRVYLPQDLLREEGIAELRAGDTTQHRALARVRARLVLIAEDHYDAAQKNLDAFAPDCRLAIHACINVYRRLNERIGKSANSISHRESVPAREKFRALPASKYWRIPLAYLKG
jgi:phytoene synthase